jgi:hypothetical protein
MACPKFEKTLSNVTGRAIDLEPIQQFFAVNPFSIHTVLTTVASMVCVTCVNGNNYFPHCLNISENKAALTD